MIDKEEITIEEIEKFLEETIKCKCLDKDMFDNYCINSKDINTIKRIIEKIKRLEERNKELEEEKERIGKLYYEANENCIKYEKDYIPKSQIKEKIEELKNNNENYTFTLTSEDIRRTIITNLQELLKD